MLVRARLGVTPPAVADRAHLSDLFLLAAGDESREVVDGDPDLRRLLASTAIDSGGSVSLYWEQYDLAPDVVSRVNLEVLPLSQSEGLLRGVLRAITRSSGAVIRSSWSEARGGGAVVVRSRALDVSKLAPGDYEIKLAVTLPGQPSATAIRRFSIVGRPGVGRGGRGGRGGIGGL
jgi:hypothetical protein